MFLLSEGWLLSGQDQRLARVIKTPDGQPLIPPPPRIGIDPAGKVRMEPARGNDSFGSCERERSLLAGGTLAIDSQTGVGTTVKLSFPLERT